MAAPAPMMISTTGIPARSRRPPEAPAFTLIELVVVMAVLTVLLALAAPSLTSSFRGHDLDQAGTQLLALTEYARDEAISQGVPMDVWIDAGTGRYGVDVKTGYPGDSTRAKQYTLGPDLHFDSTASAAPAGNLLNAAEFAPDGSLDPSSIATVRIVDRSKSGISVTETSDGYGYALQKEGR